MTLDVDINPRDGDAEYLANLNTCFGHWGGDALFDWAFRRRAGSHAPDLMVLREPGVGAIAGSAVSYRRVRGGPLEFDVGIMTGSWTLPAARGKGCFTQIIEVSRELAAAKSCGLLIAFVTHDNASRRRLEGAGSRMIPTRYVFTGAAPARQRLPVAVDDTPADEAWRRIEASRGGALHVVYPALEDFVGQCVDRAFPVDTLRVGSALVLVERTDTTDRVVTADLAGHARAEVFESLAAHAAASGRKFFGFAVGEASFEPLAVADGFLTLLVADAAALGGATLDDLSGWHLDSGDRM